ncbi:hypothetical protein [Clostridium folliculivorans]|uniref:DUF4129 domain-containing protein n=1 Tax=Clostridium folliculivorans TaxID=2886038 RepID=A0A9W5Y5J1_9CLOT|nr:hypothetical protein [Clostridium folliculivorans]GKU26888.1 hypothetical protein CFOLD11_37150 [Clostridium folliculivorans]GKU31539.1 hypothetical protein CFB3_36460 [Clostridium folliculivorans]
MNLYNFIKILYGILVSTFAFVISSIILNSIGGVNPSFYVYLITVVFMFLFYYMINNTNKYKLIIAIHNLLYFIILYGIFGKSGNLSLQMIVIIQELLLLSADGISITRDFYRNRLKSLVIGLLIGMFFTLFESKQVTTFLYPFYILFFLTGILLLRASRAFQYKLASSRRVKSYIFILVLSLVLFNPYIYSLAIGTLGILYQKIQWIIVKILYAFSLLLMYPMKVIQLLFQNKNMSDASVKMTDIPYEDQKLIQSDNTFILSVIKILFFIGIVIIILYMFKLILNRRKFKHKSKEQLFGIERESLDDSFKKKDNSIKNNWTGRKGKILEMFYDIQKETYRKNIFKKSMTANQLLNISKPYIDGDEEFKYIVDCYNEAKFSTHEVSDEMIDETRGKYKTLKNKIKEIKKI